ncbi:NAD(P)/FAD-dependent oxidoreductase [Devosia sp. CN2-171]|uniref:NAD(P)/FAD-dependent oxidoreductase n=1 Tax=Devosia sp. CN2-171 TaxID=3400909 RepID=UPI003BF7B6DB
MGANWAGEHRKIAVVGSGIAGLSAAWLLAKRYPVTLFESDRRLGGHSNTVTVATDDGPVAVDTGFIVFNEATYPNLVALLDHLGVPSQRSCMSFAASIAGGRTEYSSVSVNGFIGQRSNIVRPRFWSMVSDILRFYRAAPLLLKSPTAYADTTLGEYLDTHGYNDAFIEDHLLPMGAAIWSTTAHEMRAYPLVAFVRFFASHGLLELINRPQWRTISGGSISYVVRLSDGLDIRLNSRILGIRRHADGVDIIGTDGHVETFTDLVIATHADTALSLLADPSDDERQVLGAFRYTDNTAVLHSDTSLMPKRRRVWASWNYVGEARDTNDTQLCVTYWMNRLQELPTKTPLFVTLNPIRPVAEGKLHQAIAYTHPLFDHAALAAQEQLWRIQGNRRTWFAGSYFGHGFHEDALQSGLAAAEALGDVERPWVEPAGACRIARAPILEAAE